MLLTLSFNYDRSIKSVHVYELFLHLTSFCADNPAFIHMTTYNMAIIQDLAFIEGFVVSSA
jgi:hypothetical protein